VRLPIAHLLKLERARVLRWVLPATVSLEPGRPSPNVGAVLFFEKGERTWTCRVQSIDADEIDLAYTGPKRPREHMLELIELVRVK
jgi:hypothetical protein